MAATKQLTRVNPVDVDNSNRTLDIYNNLGGSGGGSLAASSPATPTEQKSVYEDALSKAAKEQNYKDYYDTALQLYNYEQNAKKYAANAMGAMGLQGSGYGSSMQSGISNNALNLYNANLRSYQQANQEADLGALQRKEAADVESDNQLITFMSNANTKEDLVNFLSNYGYTDKDGNIDTSKMNPYVKSIYDMEAARLGINDNSVEEGVNRQTGNLDELAKSDIYGMKGVTYGDRNKENFKTLGKMIEDGTITKGTDIVIRGTDYQYRVIRYNADGTFTEVRDAKVEDVIKNKSAIILDRGKKYTYYDIKWDGDQWWY